MTRGRTDEAQGRPRGTRQTRDPTVVRPWRPGVALVTGASVLAVLAVALVEGRADRELRRQLLRQARIAASSLDPSHLRALSGTSGDEGTTEYLLLKHQLARIREADPRIRFLYLMGRREDRTVFFFVDSEPQGSPDESPAGQVYDEATRFLHHAFDTRAEIVEGPARDRWGTWMTAFIPVEVDGRLMVFGMDVDARGWRAMVAAAAAVPGVLVALAALLGVLVVLLRGATLRARAIANTLESVFRASPVGLAVVVDRRFVRVNDALCAIAGVDAQDLLGRPTRVVYPDEEEYERVGRLVYEPVARGQLGFVEARVRRGDGQLRRVVISAAPLDPSHPERGVGVGVLDLTDRLEAADRLRQSHSLLQATMEATADGILVWDLEGKVTSWNHRFLELWGIPASLAETTDGAAFLRLMLDRLVDPEGFPSRVQELQAIPEGTATGEVRLKAGRVFEWQSQPQLLEGRVGGRVWSFRDVTSRVRTEEALRRSLSEKEVLLREVHHRVKNALQGVIGLVALRIEKIADPAIRRSLEELQEQARAMALAYERLYQSSDVTTVDMEPYLRDICEGLVWAFGGDREVRVTVRAASVRVPAAKALPCGLIVNELVTNSLKHAFPPSVRPTGTIQVSLEHAGNGAILTVSDDGVGVPEGKALLRDGGMGLHLVRMWATHQLGGTVETAVGPGVRVTVRFSVGDTAS